MRKLTCWLATGCWVVALLALVAPLCAQQAAERRVIPLGIYDVEGRLRAGLRSEQITVKGIRARVASVKEDSGPRRIVLLLDMSTSMRPVGTFSPWEVAKLAVQEFLNAVQPDDQLSLQAFAEKHRIVVPFTSDKTRIRQALESLPEPGTTSAKKDTGHNTEFGIALEAMLTALAGQIRPGDAVVVFSDGTLGAERKPFSKFTRRLGGIGLRVSVVLCTPPYTPGHPLWDDAPLGIRVAEMRRLFDSGGFFRKLESFAQETGGIVWDPWDVDGNATVQVVAWPEPQQLARVARMAYWTLRNIYRLELELDRALNGPKKIKLEIRGRKGEKLLDRYAHYPRYLLPSSLAR